MSRSQVDICEKSLKIFELILDYVSERVMMNCAKVH